MAASSEGNFFYLASNGEIPPWKGSTIVFGNSSIHPPPEVPTPVLEIEHGMEDVFLSGFTLAEARVVQTILAVNEGVYVSAQSVYLMNKLQHIPGMGLGKRSRKGVAALDKVPHNRHTLGWVICPPKRIGYGKVRRWLGEPEQKR